MLSYHFWISYSYTDAEFENLRQPPALQKRGWIPLHREGSTRLCVVCNVKVLHRLFMGYGSLLLMYPVKYEWANEEGEEMGRNGHNVKNWSG